MRTSINDPDQDWERFGATDPYWAVLTEPENHGANFTPARAEAFFASGERHVATLFDTIRTHLDPHFHPRRVMDFGCGVGRVVIPLAARVETVVGADVSQSMIAEARRNCDVRGVTNVEFVQSTDPELSGLAAPFDFIHSFIVFQHIRPARGERLARRLVELLRDGGVGAMHFTYRRQMSVGQRARLWARTRIPFANAAMNIVLGRPASHPVMQLNAYSVDRLMSMLSEMGCHQVHVRFSDHKGNKGVMLFFRKTRTELL